MSKYTGYNEIGKKASIKYIKEKQRDLRLKWKKDDFEQRIEPIIKASGLPIATFIKEAVEEKIKRETESIGHTTGNPPSENR